MTETPLPVCKFEEGCHRVSPCNPGCGTTGRTFLVEMATQAIRDSNGTPEALDWWRKYPQLIPAHVYAAAVLSVLPALDEEAQRATRRDALRHLAARASSSGLTHEDAALLRDGIDAEIREADTARAVAAGNKRHVQTIVPEIESLTSELKREQAASSGLAAKIQEQRAALDTAHARADQAEDLLKVAHETFNRSEAERASVQQRAEDAERDARIYRGRLDYLREARTEQRQLAEQAQATIERVRHLVTGAAQTTADGISDHAIGRYDLAVEVVAALDGTEPAGPADDEALRAKVDEATATLRRLRALGADLEYEATGIGLAEPAREAMRDAARRIRSTLAGRHDDTEQPITEQPSYAQLRAAYAESWQLIEMQKEFIGTLRRIVMTATSDREDENIRAERCERCGRDHMAELYDAIVAADERYAEAYPATAEGPARPGRLPETEV